MPKERLPECRFNANVSCRANTTGHGCAKCGWNPEENERRNAEVSAWNWNPYAPSEELQHLTITKEVRTIGNSNPDTDSGSTSAEGGVELSRAESMAE